MAKYALDTSVYIEGLRDAAAASALKRFLAAALPSTYLSAVVMLELRAGARRREQIEAVEAGIFAPFERRRRVLVPSAHAFVECGRVLADLAVKEGLDLATAKRSLTNDVLLAVSCQEMGVTLVTRDSDYGRIARYLKGFRHVAPWPPVATEPSRGR